MDDLIREMALDENAENVAPSKEVRKWMAARSHILETKGTLVRKNLSFNFCLG